jgi:hypothetical protein
MRLPRVRFSIRQFMVAVATVALAMAIRIECARIRLWSLDYQLRSLNHGLAAMSDDGRPAFSCRGPFEFPSLVRNRNPRKAVYHAAMSRKWAEAAERAWLPVTPDPPEPD